MNPKIQEEGSSIGNVKLQNAVDAVWEKVGNLPLTERRRLERIARAIIQGEHAEPVNSRP